MGLKSGKNQQDREMKQNIYKKLYLDFKYIQNSLENNEPLNYEDYETVKTSSNRYVSATPLKQLEINGDIIYLNSKIKNEAEDTERKYFLWSYKLHNEIPKKIFDALPKSTDLVEGEIKFNSYQGIENNHINISKSRVNSYKVVQLSILDFAFNKPEAIKRIRNMPIDEGMKLQISYRQGSKNIYSYSIQSTAIKNKTDFINTLINNLSDNINELKLITSKKYHIKRYDSITKKIEKKAIDPDGFWETLISSFKDVFIN